MLMDDYTGILLNAECLAYKAEQDNHPFCLFAFSIINAGVKNFLTRGVNIKKKYFQESIKTNKELFKKVKKLIRLLREKQKGLLSLFLLLK